MNKHQSKSLTNSQTHKKTNRTTRNKWITTKTYLSTKKHPYYSIKDAPKLNCLWKSGTNFFFSIFHMPWSIARQGIFTYASGGTDNKHGKIRAVPSEAENCGF